MCKKYCFNKLLAIIIMFTFLFTLIPVLPASAVGETPIVAKYEMEDTDTTMTDTSGNSYNGTLKDNATFTSTNGRSGQGKALKLYGGYAEFTGAHINKLGSEFSISAWVRPDNLNSYQTIVGKRPDDWMAETFHLGITTDKKIRFSGSYGGGWYDWTSSASTAIAAGTWVHIAVSFKKGSHCIVYVNGTSVLSKDATAAKYALAASDLKVQVGRDWRNIYGTVTEHKFSGLIDSLRVYPVALSSTQVTADKDNTLTTRTAGDSDIPTPWKYVKMRLTRFDMPVGQKKQNNDTYYKAATRVTGAMPLTGPT